MNPIPVIVRGIQINSALYLAGAFVAGLVVDNPLAWKLALAAIGVTYLSYLAQMPRMQPRPEYRFDPTPEAIYPPRIVGIVLVVASIALGAAAGIALVF